MVTLAEDRKADPDEKGTESGFCHQSHCHEFVDRKADPDEKGTERKYLAPRSRAQDLIAKLIPMKRELKAGLTHTATYTPFCKSQS